MNASAHRANARDALRGHWMPAVVVGVLGTLFGVSSNYSSVNLNFRFESDGQFRFQFYAPVEQDTTLLQTALGEWLGLAAGTVLLITSIIAILQFLLAGAVQLGVCRYNLNLIDRTESLIDDVLAGLPLFRKAFMMHFLAWLFLTPGIATAVFGMAVQSVLLLVLSALLLLPVSIVLTYSFAMAPYILLEDPDCTGWQALKRSHNMMKGHKWELFCLGFSFLGWSILAALTFGIGGLFLNPYANAANASFYRNLQNQGYAPAEEF